MSRFLLPMSALIYLVGSVGYFVYLIKANEAAQKAAYRVMALGFALHTGSVIASTIALGHFPITGLREGLVLFSWAVVGAFLLFQLKVNLKILGAFVSPLAVMLLLLSPLFPPTVVLKASVFKSGLLVMHVGLTILGDAVFALAFVGGFMYLVQERQIKSKNFGFFYKRFPSLESLDKLNHYCLVVGFPLLTVGLMLGFLYAGMVWKSYWHWDPKEVLAVATWLIYAVLLHERLAVGWRGRRAAIMAIVGFCAVLATFIGANYFLEGHHSIMGVAAKPWGL